MTPAHLERVVRKLCPLVAEQSQANQSEKIKEEDLILELVCCILSSQVPYSMAVAATHNLEREGLLSCDRWKVSDSRFNVEIQQILLGEMAVEGRYRRYRFPNIRASQITRTRDAIVKNCGEVSEMLRKTTNPRLLRRTIISNVCGMGAKQASMFIRNIKLSYELAVLDRHVLKYMAILGIISSVPTSISMSRYEFLEVQIKNYANAIGYPIGYVDWAIWITMQAAKEKS